MTVGAALIIVVAAATITASLIVLLRPLLKRYALARPNARSSHVEPTPQGGGIAVVAAIVAAVGAAVLLVPIAEVDALWFALLFGAVVLIALVGAIDDIRPLAVIPRLALQAVAVAAMLAALPAELRIAPALPWWAERGLMLAAGLWFVNLTNFMDGIDWMTVAEAVPVTAALAILGFSGALPRPGLVIALALGGAMLGFAPFNRPVARLFLGDVGSLPVGLLLAWLLALLAGSGHLAAALILPFYYGADATLTLLRRLLHGERIWEAHRSHFYQRATKGGFAVGEIVARVFAVNVALALLAGATVRFDALPAALAALAGAIVMVGWLLVAFARGKRQ
jgi:UDP-N-acetylmuramyl pentapeptide phosphotransferase/UDP-N-acetylglucosamine-1-phosphate transferase